MTAWIGAAISGSAAKAGTVTMAGPTASDVAAFSAATTGTATTKAARPVPTSTRTAIFPVDIGCPFSRLDCMYVNESLVAIVPSWIVSVPEYTLNGAQRSAKNSRGQK